MFQSFDSEERDLHACLGFPPATEEFTRTLLVYVPIEILRVWEVAPPTPSHQYRFDKPQMKYSLLVCRL